MRAHLKHIGTEKNAKLPLHIHEPCFLCNPSHRIKVMVKDIFTLALQSKSKSNAEKIDAMRVKKYCGCWIGKSKLLPFDKFKNYLRHQLSIYSIAMSGATKNGALQLSFKKPKRKYMERLEG